MFFVLSFGFTAGLFTSLKRAIKIFKVKYNLLQKGDNDNVYGEKTQLENKKGFIKAKA